MSHLILNQILVMQRVIPRNLIALNVKMEFLTDDKGINCYKFQILDCDSKMAYDLINDFVTKSLYKGGYSFLNEEFFGISSPLELKGMIMLIQCNNNEIASSTIE
ncbi:hypothetical protein F8M41_023123 [Gigaspora margarita]|uniref:Uncharacterized protein n=1 Tax=Gigaspora margarita TaxID=4874 RepID=A0A8H4EHH8_GIGMA|nr:hypothetical protein F8M41_023123 [Gigaspora margarita]